MSNPVLGIAARWNMVTGKPMLRFRRQHTPHPIEYTITPASLARFKSLEERGVITGMRTIWGTQRFYPVYPKGN